VFVRETLRAGAEQQGMRSGKREPSSRSRGCSRERAVHPIVAARPQALRPIAKCHEGVRTEAAVRPVRTQLFSPRWNSRSSTRGT
jgi:hypothetical protein